MNRIVKLGFGFGLVAVIAVAVIVLTVTTPAAAAIKFCVVDSSGEVHGCPPYPGPVGPACSCVPSGCSLSSGNGCIYTCTCQVYL